MSEQNNSNQPAIDQRTFELLNAAIDGELGPAEEAELNSLLAESAELRDFVDDHRSFIRLLNDVPERAPPAYLQEAIERQIRLPIQSESQTTLKTLAGSFNPKNWLRTGLALAAGVVMTVGVYQMGSGPMTNDDAANLTGTIIEKPYAEQGELLDSVYIYTDTLRGAVELRSQGDLFSLDVDVKSDGLSRVIVNIAGRGLEFEGIAEGQNFDNDVTVRDGAINIVSEGAQRYSLLLRQVAASGPATPLELEFFANDRLVQAAILGKSR
jgi:hypothetical protein